MGPRSGGGENNTTAVVFRLDGGDGGGQGLVCIDRGTGGWEGGVQYRIVQRHPWAWWKGGDLERTGTLEKGRVEGER